MAYSKDVSHGDNTRIDLAAPRNPLRPGATVCTSGNESRVTSPPIAVQDLLLPPSSALAKILGVRPCYHRWDSQA